MQKFTVYSKIWQVPGITSWWFVGSGIWIDCCMCIVHRSDLNQVLRVHLSRLMTKPTKWLLRPAKTQNSLGIHPVWSESLLSAWRTLGSLATHWACSGDWPDWADAQAGLNLCWAHIWFCCFCREVAHFHFLPFIIIISWKQRHICRFITCCIWLCFYIGKTCQKINIAFRVCEIPENLCISSRWCQYAENAISLNLITLLPSIALLEFSPFRFHSIIPALLHDFTHWFLDIFFLL